MGEQDKMIMQPLAVNVTTTYLGSRYLMLKLTRLYSSYNGVLLCNLHSRIHDTTRYVHDNMCGGLSENGR